MIDTLVGALRLSLDKCNAIQDPNEYGFELNQVLNRFKSNLFKMIPDKAKHLYDPKEFIQIRLTFHWKTWGNKPGNANVKEHAPILLHVNGFIPELGLRANRERTFIKTVDVSDIIDIGKIANISTEDTPEYAGVNTKSTALLKSGLRNPLTCVFHETLGAFEGVRTYTMQISALVFREVDKDERSYVVEADREKVKPLNTCLAIVASKSHAQAFLLSNVNKPAEDQPRV